MGSLDRKWRLMLYTGCEQGPTMVISYGNLTRADPEIWHQPYSCGTIKRTNEKFLYEFQNWKGPLWPQNVPYGLSRRVFETQTPFYLGTKQVITNKDKLPKTHVKTTYAIKIVKLFGSIFLLCIQSDLLTIINPFFGRKISEMWIFFNVQVTIRVTFSIFFFSN